MYRKIRTHVERNIKQAFSQRDEHYVKISGKYWSKTNSQFLVKLIFVSIPLNIIVIDVSLKRLEMAFSENYSKAVREVYSTLQVAYM